MRGNRTLVLSSILVAVVSLVAACGKASPTTPSSVNAPNAAGATIAGSLSGSSVSSISTQSTGSMTVSVVGTMITAAIDGSGHFLLTGVPAGDVHLRFHGGNTDATATLTAVQSGDSITITVTVNGSSAVIDSDSRKSNSQTELEGVITAIPPTTAAGSFMIGSTTVQTNSSTTFDEDGAAKAFADLKVGLRVHVSGTASSSTTFAATRVELQPPDQEPAEATATGTISGLTGTPPTLTFVVGGVTIHTNANTRVDAGEDDGGDMTLMDDGGNDQGSSIGLSILQNGFTVTVEGTKQPDGSILASEIKLSTVTVKGTIAGLAGTCPAIHFTLGATNVTTSAATGFEEMRCTSLKNGTVVAVRGAQSGTTLTALKVEASGGDGGF